jgi:3-isopropylmalate dehydrogenase
LKNEAPFNITFIRENTEDFYMGAGGVLKGGKGKASLRIERSMYDLGIDMESSSSNSDDYAFEIGILSRKGVERFVDFVMGYAKRAGLDNVTVVDKANVCTSLYGLWREVFRERSEKTGVGVEFMFVDAMAMALVRNPGRYGVVATPNMFGDILTDLGAEIQGSLGLSASGNINPSGVSMFEPVHGSAPDIAGKKKANPFGAILAAKLMLDHLGKADLGKRIENGVGSAMKKGIVTPDLGGGSTTDEVGDAVADHVRCV